MAARRLIVLSVPLVRVVRALLGNHVLDALTADADVVVVAPFADEPTFREEFARPKLQFLQWQPPQRLQRVLGAVFAISELMRMQGYYRVYRQRGLGYHWRTSFVKFGEDGADVPEPLRMRLAIHVASLVGRWPAAWRWLDAWVGRWLFRFPALSRLAGQYDVVTLIQASSWGMQDRMLAWLARSENFRTMLLPYTTDQLWVNGHLLCDYDAVCVQGPFEEKCAIEYHGVPQSRVVRLGSMWFRKIDAVKPAEPALGAAPRRLRVMYAGVSRLYFPRASEFEAIDAILAAISSGKLANAELFYRAFPTTDEERRVIEQRYAGRPHIQLQWPEEACAGLYDYPGTIETQLHQYLTDLSAVDVVVMSQLTSLGWDAGYLGCAVIANVADSTGVLDRRFTALRFNASGELDFAPGLPVTRSVEDLVRVLQGVSANGGAVRAAARSLASQWDYPGEDFRSLLRRTVLVAERGSVARRLPPSTERACVREPNE